MSHQTLSVLDELITKISITLPIKLQWNFPDDCNANLHLLEKLQKYEILNVDDIDCTNKTNIDLHKIISIYKQMSLDHSKKLKLLIIVRHGDGEHNAARRIYGTLKWRESNGYNRKYHDPSLTEKGIQQSKALRSQFESVAHDIDLVVLSPLLRAIQTASHSLFPILDTKHNRKCDMVVLEYARERMNPYTCDSRSSLKHIQNVWRSHDFSYEGFEDNHDVKWSIYARESREEMWMRANALLDYVFDRKEDIVFYFGHGSFSESIMQVIHRMPAFHMKNTQYVPIIMHKMKKQNGFL